MDIMEMLAQQQQGPPMDPETARLQREHALAVHQLELELGQAERLTLLEYAWLFCRCQRRFTWNDGPADPPQAGCMVHGSFMMAPDGKVIG